MNSNIKALMIFGVIGFTVIGGANWVKIKTEEADAIRMAPYQNCLKERLWSKYETLSAQQRLDAIHVCDEEH